MRAAFFVLLFAASCGDPRVIDGKSYSTRCTAASDCVGVFFGNQCGPCACPNAAIATSERVIYEADRSSALAVCGPRPAIACSPCQNQVPRCQTSPTSEEGICQL